MADMHRGPFDASNYGISSALLCWPIVDAELAPLQRSPGLSLSHRVCPAPSDWLCGQGAISILEGDQRSLYAPQLINRSVPIKPGASVLSPMAFDHKLLGTTVEPAILDTSKVRLGEIARLVHHPVFHRTKTAMENSR
jgi:hypothetical protein